MSDCHKDRSCAELIDSLCGELKSCCPLRHPLKRLFPFVLFVVAYISFSVGFIGLRPDFAEKITHVPYVFELTLIFFMSIFSAISSAWLCVPDMRQQKWLLSVSLTLFATFFMWTFLRAGLESYILPHLHWHGCYTVSIIFGAIPAVFIFLLSMKGKTTQPLMLSAMNALAIGGAGYIGLRLICTTDDIGHLCIFHIVPYILFAFIASVVGRRIYRW